MTEPSGAPKPIAVAYAVLAWMIDGKEYIGEIDRDRELIHACLFDGASGPAVVAWSIAGEQVLLLPPSEIPVTVRNLMGNTIKLPENRRLKLSSEPVYIQSGPDTGAEKLAAMLSLQPE